MFEALQSKWKEFLLRMFDIRVGEFRRVWLMQLNVFLLILALWIIKPVVNAQFISRVGIDKLPLVFLLVALTALVVSTGYSRLLHRWPLNRVINRTYLISLVGLLSFAILMQTHLFQNWMAYIFYIGVALFGLVTTSQFWLLGNLVFNSLEAKRLFGFIGAGAIVGGIGGGYVTSTLAPLMDSQNLLFLAAGLLMISMFVNRSIWSTAVPVSDSSSKIIQPKSLHEYPLRLIRNSKHLTYLALIMGISVVVDKLVEFQFSSIASSRISDPDQLTAYFGFWFSTANLISLGIQLVLTQRLIAFLGVGRSLFVFPATMFASAATVLYTPVLWAGTTLKLIDISLKQSINKAATELLILPIPMAIKSQAKTFIDIFVDTTATGIGGILLIFIVNGFHLSVRAVCIMILGLIGLWIYLVKRVRKEYALAFQEKLGMAQQTTLSKDFLLSDNSVASGIRRALQSGTSNQILFLLARIEESKNPRYMPDLLPLLNHQSPTIRQAALRALYYHTDHTITEQIEPLLKDPDDEVRSRAFSCLLAHTRQNRVQFIEDFLNDKDLAIRSAAIVGLATEARGNLVMQHLFNLEERLIAMQTEHLNDPEAEEVNKIMIARAIGYGKLAVFYPLLMTYMKDPNPAISKQAILSAGTSQDRIFLKLLLQFLSNPATNWAAQNAIAKYEPEEILPWLKERIRDKGITDAILMQMPALALNMDTQEAIDYLFELLQQPNQVVKFHTLEILHKMKTKFPHLKIGGKQILPLLMEEANVYRDTLALSYAAQRKGRIEKEDPNIIIVRKELIDLLENKLDSILERIFRVLGLSYPSGMMMPMLQDLHHQDPDIRMNTVELLDNILEPALKKVVIPIVETAIQDSLSEDMVSVLDLNVATEASCFHSLLKGEDEELKLTVLKLIEALHNPDLVYLIQMAAEDKNPMVSRVAKIYLEEE